MITAEQVKTLRKTKLAHVCIINGELRNALNGSELSIEDSARVRKILAMDSSSDSSLESSANAAPAKTVRKRKD